MSTALDRSATAADEVAPAGGGGERVPPPEYLRRAQPWRRGESLIAGVLAAIGLGGLLACWIGVSGELVWRDQLGALAGAGLFTALVVFAAAVWLAVGMGRVRAGFRALAAARREVYELDRVEVEVSVTAVLAGSDQLVTVASMTRAHRPGCLLMRGKTPVPVPPAEAERYTPCGVCGT